MEKTRIANLQIGDQYSLNGDNKIWTVMEHIDNGRGIKVKGRMMAANKQRWVKTVPGTREVWRVNKITNGAENRNTESQSL